MNTELVAKYAPEWEQIGIYDSSWGPDVRDPMRNFPITERENFQRLFQRKRPMYIPVITDMLPFAPRLIVDNYVRAWALEVEACLPGSDCPGGKDMFGVQWDYIPVTAGSMVRGGNPLVKDITHWEDYVTFPNLDKLDWERSARVNAKLFNPRRMNRVWVMNGLNERLISFMDFAEVMVAYIDDEQKEGVHRLFDRLCLFYDDLFDRFHRYYHCDVIMFNDDWGTQRGPQFSPDTAREMLVPYMKRLAQSCHKRGMYFELHSCGKNDLLAPVIQEADVDLWLPQEDVNDYDLLYRLIGQKVFLGIPSDSTPEMTDEEAWDSAQRFYDRFARHGNVILNTTFPAQHPRIVEFLYAITREGYAKPEA